MRWPTIRTARRWAPDACCPTATSAAWPCASARGLGVGGQILDALIGQGHGDGHRMLVLHAQTHAAGFYEAHGFQVEGEEFMEAGIAHVVMTRTLA